MTKKFIKSLIDDQALCLREKILLFYMRRLISKTTSLPVIGGIDSILGALVGGLIGIVIIVVLYFVIGYIQFLPSMNYIKQQII